MALAHWQRTFTDTAGNIQPSIEVTIRNESTGALAAIYTDSAGATPKSNPFTTDSFGYGDFYAADGRYRIQATGIDWRDEEVLTFENLQAAVDDAEAARDAATLNAGIYDNTTDGLAATVDGEYFSTPAAGAEDYLTLYRNDSGVATEIDTYPNSEALNKRIIYVGSVEELSAGNFSIGSSVETLGYYAPGDGGGNDYEIVAGGTGTADGGSFIDLDNGLQAKGLFLKGVEVEQFGVQGGGTDDATPLQNALTFASGKGLKISGDFTTFSVLDMPNPGVFIFGVGSIIAGATMENGGSGVGHSIFNCQSTNDFHFVGITLDTSLISTFLSATRAITNNLCSNFSVRHCKFIVSGAATASTACDNYDISHNNVRVASTDGAPHNDGVIDQWWGSNNFTIHSNIVDGATISKYNILVTGEATDTSAAGCYNFSIIGNNVKDSREAGIWSNGRSGVNSDFTIIGNTVDGVSNFFGLGVSDSTDFAVSGNKIKQVETVGIKLYEETGARGVTGVRRFACTGNEVTDANEGLSGSDTAGSAITVEGSTSTTGTVVGNTTSGSNHRRSVVLASGVSNITESANNDSGATQFPAVVDSSSTNSNLISGGTFNASTTNVTNVTSSAVKMNYMCSGNEIIIHHEITIQSTAAGSASIRFTIPVSSNFAAVDDAIGNATDAFGNTCTVSADTSNNELTATIQAGSGTTFVLRGSSSYKVR